MSVSRFRLRFALMVAALLGVLGATAAGRNNDRVVDSGSFAILVNGQRVATESFRIDQNAADSVATSEFKSEHGDGGAQKSELRITSSGDLRYYEWHELAPAKAQVVVEPAEQFLTERVVPEPPQKPFKQSFMMPTSTTVLDDFVFIHREILAWRYLAEACGGKLEHCHPAPAQFGVLVPQQRSPLVVTVEYAGPEKIKLNGVERQVSRLNLKIAEEPDWALYMDMDLKLVRIVIQGTGTEVVRQ